MLPSETERQAHDRREFFGIGCLTVVGVFVMCAGVGSMIAKKVKELFNEAVESNAQILSEMRTRIETQKKNLESDRDSNPDRFKRLAIELNEIIDGFNKKIAPTNAQRDHKQEIQPIQKIDIRDSEKGIADANEVMERTRARIEKQKIDVEKFRESNTKKFLEVATELNQNIKSFNKILENYPNLQNSQGNPILPVKEIVIDESAEDTIPAGSSLREEPVRN